MAASVHAGHGNKRSDGSDALKQSKRLQPSYTHTEDDVEFMNNLKKPVPRAEDCLKKSVVWKVQKDGVWVERELFLMKKEVGFSHLGGKDMQDYIELREIDKVIASDGGGGRLLDNVKKEERFCFTLGTAKTGMHHGRTFEFKLDTEQERDAWIDAIKAQRNVVSIEEVWSPALYKAQTALKSLVQDWRYQFVVVTAIVTNFLCNIVEATMNPVPEGSQAEKNFVVIDLFFIVFFTVELVMNIGAHWFFEFWEDRANWLDTGVVLISLVGLTMQGGGAFTVIRIMRVLRVVRVFKRIASVRLIVTALGAAVVPVSNAFFIMILATTIWAILGVNLFDKRSPEFFGNFGAAFFTMFQCVTGDSWASAIARPLFIVEPGEPAFDAGVFIFFISYMLIVSMVVVNVVLAVLLDEFLRAASEQHNILAMDRISSSILDNFQTSLDPLLEHLAHSNSLKELSSNCATVFKVMDFDASGELTYEELALGLQKLPFEPAIDMTPEDFSEVIQGVLHPETCAVTMDDFIKVMVMQTYKYMHRRADKSLVLRESGVDMAEDTTNLFVLKYLTAMMDLEGSANMENRSQATYPFSQNKSPLLLLEASAADRHSNSSPAPANSLREHVKADKEQILQGQDFSCDKSSLNEAADPPPMKPFPFPADRLAETASDKLIKQVDDLSKQQREIQEACTVIHTRVRNMENAFDNRLSGLESMLRKLLECPAFQTANTVAKEAPIHAQFPAMSPRSSGGGLHGTENRPGVDPQKGDFEVAHRRADSSLSTAPAGKHLTLPRPVPLRNTVHLNGGRPSLSPDTQSRTSAGIPVIFSSRSEAWTSIDQAALDVNVPILNKAASSPRPGMDTSGVYDSNRSRGSGSGSVLLTSPRQSGAPLTAETPQLSGTPRERGL